MARPLRVAVIGDVHLAWDDRDVELIDDAGYDLVAFVGDLAGYRRGALEVASSIRKLRTPTLVIPGNHDAASLPHLAAETLERRALARALGWDQTRRVEALERALGPHPLVGYSHHALGGISFIAARPHSQGGSFLAFSRHLEQRFGVGSVEQSAARLCREVDEAAHDRLVFLAHNGPTGLGDRRTDIWGCDFRKAEGDWGDPDLRAAISHARAKDKRVLAVIAGHMHHRVKGGGERAWRVEQDGILYVNAARVPRIERHPAGERRYHVCFETDGETARAELLAL